MAENTDFENDKICGTTPALQSGEGKKEKKVFLNQVVLATSASLGYLSVGLVRGYSSSAVPSMRALDAHLMTATKETESWISAIPPLGAAVGSLCAGPLVQWLGRRRTLLASAPVAVAAWASIGAATSLPMVLTARLITGFCAGVAIPSAQIYVSECSDPNVRGVLGSFPALFMAGGILLSYVLGAWLPWRPLAWASAAVPTLMFVVLLPLPESPAWLAARGRHQDADDADAWLHRCRKTSRASAAEALIAAPEQPPPKNFGSITIPSPQPEPPTSLFRRPVLIPLLLSLTLLVFQQVSGIDAVVFYTVSIFRSAGSTLDEHVATIVIGVVQLLANSLSLVIIDRTGRRPLLIASGMLMSVAMAALGTYFQLLDAGTATNLGLLPLVSLIVFMIGFSIGYCNIPFLLMGELLPTKQRNMFSSLAGAFNLTAMFVVIKTFPDLRHAVGSQGAFWIYSAVCLSSCLFVALLVPETKGKSLDEIERYFEMRHVAKRPPRSQ